MDQKTVVNRVDPARLALMRNGFFALLLAALAFALAAGSAVAQTPPDRDGDGLADVGDACPGSPGPASNSGCPPAGDMDWDGIPDSTDPCPDTSGTVCDPPKNTDGDELPDVLDVCPLRPGPLPYGCAPPGDYDWDGIPDREDPCPEVIGVVCDTPTDADGDGLTDLLDVCPYTAGPTEWPSNGCPGWGPPKPKPTPTPTATPAPAPSPAPPADPAPEQVTFSLVVDAASTNRQGTRLTSVSAKRVPAGSTLTVKCAGKKCSNRLRKGLALRNQSGTVKLGSLFKERLSAGTVVSVGASKPGAAGATSTVHIRKGKKPLVTPAR